MIIATITGPLEKNPKDARLTGAKVENMPAFVARSQVIC